MRSDCKFGHFFGANLPNQNLEKKLKPPRRTRKRMILLWASKMAFYQDTISFDVAGRTFFPSPRFSNQIQTFFCYSADSKTLFHEKPGEISSVVCRQHPRLFFLCPCFFAPLTVDSYPLECCYRNLPQRAQSSPRVSLILSVLCALCVRK